MSSRIYVTSAPLLSGNISNTNSSTNQAHVTIVFTTSDHVSTLLKLASRSPLRMIVIFDRIPLESAKLFAEWGQSVGIKVQELHERTCHY